MIFLKDETILKRLDRLKTKGFESLHLPGGTSKDGDYYSGAIVAKYDPKTKKMYFLGVPYNSRFHLLYQNGHNKKSGELPDLTIIRELMEETGLQAKSEDLWLVLHKKIPDNRPEHRGEFHRKFYYLIIEFTGKIFNFKGANPIDQETAAPLWLPAGMFVSKVFKGHLEAVYAAIEELSSMSKEYALALMNVVPR